MTNLVRQSVYSRLAGYEDVNDTERLTQDPAFRLSDRLVPVDHSSRLNEGDADEALRRRQLPPLDWSKPFDEALHPRDPKTGQFTTSDGQTSGVVDEVDRLPVFGKPSAWRGGRSAVPHGTTAADVVRYERDELGNESEYEHLGAQALKDLEHYDVLWVTRTKSAARRYGEPMQVNVPAGARVIANDLEGGYLLAIPRKEAAKAAITLTKDFDEALHPRTRRRSKGMRHRSNRW